MGGGGSKTTLQRKADDMRNAIGNSKHLYQFSLSLVHDVLFPPYASQTAQDKVHIVTEIFNSIEPEYLHEIMTYRDSEGQTFLHEVSFNFGLFLLIIPSPPSLPPHSLLIHRLLDVELCYVVNSL
jgi:hypothetical protein